jgi:hypothetical protein
MSMIMRDFGEGTTLGNPLLMLLPQLLGKMAGSGGQGQGAGAGSGGGGLMSLLNTFISSAAQAPGAQPPPITQPPVMRTDPTPTQVNWTVTGNAPPSPCTGPYIYSSRFNFCWNPSEYASEDDAARAMGMMADRAQGVDGMLPTPPSAAQQQFRPFQQPQAGRAAAGGRRGRKAARKGRRGRRGLRDAYALGAAAGGTSTLAIVLTTLGGVLVVGAAVYGYKRSRAA